VHRCCRAQDEARRQTTSCEVGHRGCEGTACPLLKHTCPDLSLDVGTGLWAPPCALSWVTSLAPGGYEGLDGVRVSGEDVVCVLVPG
jgi:hypothetical protein